MIGSDRTGFARLQMVFSALSFLIGLILLLIRYDLAKDLGFSVIKTVALSGSFISAGMGTALLLYLRGDVAIRPLDRFTNPGTRAATEGVMSQPEIEAIRVDLEQLRASISKAAAAVHAPGVDTDALLETLRADFPHRVAAELEERFARDSAGAASVAGMRRAIENSIARLREEIASLSRRGSLNLVIGTLTTALAVVLLAYMVLGADVKFTDLTSLLSHYIPRVSTVAFIEIFAFFFLRLYRTGLEEIKFYQNELTNLSLRAVAVEAALLDSDTKSRLVVIEQLVRSDRNQGVAPTSPTTKGDAGELTELLGAVTKVIGELAKKQSV